MLIIARFIFLAGTIAMLVVVVFTDNDEYFSIQVDREFTSDITEAGQNFSTSNYQGSVLEARLDSTTKRFKLIFTKGVRYCFIAVVVVMAAFSVYFIHLLLQFVKSAMTKSFFNFQNVVRIRSMGFILIGLGSVSFIMRMITHYFAQSYFEKETALTGVTVSFDPDVFTNGVFIGLIVLIVAQAFDHGLRLKEEQDLTI